MLRLIKWLFIVAIVLGSLQWFAQQRANSKITETVAEMQAKLPIEGDGVTIRKLEFANHVLRFGATVAPGVELTAQRSAQFQATLQDAYCTGKEKPFMLAGVTVEYDFVQETGSGPQHTLIFSVIPQQCTGAVASAYQVLPNAAAANERQLDARLNAGGNPQPQPQPQLAQPQVAQPLSEEDQRRALAGNQQCINGAVVEYTSATHSFDKLGPPDVHCTDRMADTPLR